MTKINQIINTPAPRWFLKTKKALTILADTACIILITTGFGEDSFLILLLRVGLSGILQTLEVILTEDLRQGE